jgi:hypothetical protein
VFSHPYFRTSNVNQGETRIVSAPKNPYFEYVILNSIQGPEGSSLLGISSETGRANIGKIPHLGI